MAAHKEIKKDRRQGSRRKNDQWFRLLVEAMNEGLAVQDEKGLLTYVNPKLCEILGYSLEEMLGTHWHKFFDKANQDILEGQLDQRRKGKNHAYEIAWTTKNKQKVFTLMSPQPFFDKEGCYKGSFVVVVDITERKQIEKQLRILSKAIEQSPTAVLITDLQGDIQYVNPMFTQLTGYVIEELIGKNFFTLPWRKALPSNTMAVGYEWRGEVRNKKRNGERYWAIESISPVKNEQGIVTHYIMRQEDITHRKRAEEALIKSERELKILSARLLAVQEQERKRIASELHDGIGQYLNAVKFSLENISNLPGKSLAKPAPQLWMDTLSLLQKAIEETRRIAMDLRPSILDDVGLLATISWFCRQFQTIYSGIHIQSHIDILEEEIPGSLKIVIYRIIQEALNNIAKHAQTDMAYLSLKKDGDVIGLIIEDKGQGFKVAKPLSKEASIKGLGLVSMKERTELVGGSFLLKSILQGGTKIRASWPLSKIEKSSLI